MQKMKQSPQARNEQKSFNHYVDEIELLSKKRASSVRKKIPVIEDSVGYFLSLICAFNKPAEILEIGCGTGYSTYFLLRSIKHRSRYTGIDLNRERIIEAEAFIKDIFAKRKFFSRRLDFINGNALKIIPDLDRKFDLVFIDAAKFEYLGYVRSLEGKLQHGAVVVADNILYEGKIFRTKPAKHDRNSVTGLRGYIEFVNRSDFFDNYFFNIGDGLLLSKYKPFTK